MEVLYFILLVGALIFVHELGHFACAKAFGVEVQRFSIGFGPRVAGVRIGETEYVVAALPIGGYVKMLGENPHDEVRPEQRSRSFQAQPLHRRVAIVMAGPAMNLAFPLLLFFGVHFHDSLLPPPVIGVVYPSRPADGRLLPGDRVLEADGEPIRTFDELKDYVAERPDERIVLTLERRGERVEQVIVPVPTQQRRELGRVETVGRLGIHPQRRTAIVGVLPDSPAASAGLQTFDEIVAVAGQPVALWSEVEAALAERSGLVPITYLRPEASAMLDGIASVELHQARVASLNLPSGEAGGALRAGFESAELYVAEVVSGSPEEALGLRRGDRLVTLDGPPVRNWATLLEDLRVGGATPRQLAWRRGTTLHRGMLELEVERGVTEHGQSYERQRVGMYNRMPLRAEPGVPTPTPLRRALAEAWEETSEMVSLTTYSLVRLLQRRLGVESLGGPLMIFSATREAAREGTTSYLRLMAFISVNLGLINLLPIPLLDGGHLLFFLVEGVSRRRVSKRARSYAGLVGLAVLLLLMIIAFKNDLNRAFPDAEAPASAER